MATSTRKKSTRKKTNTKRRTKKQEAEFRNEVILWIVLAISIIIFISNLGFGGIVGNKLSSFFFGIFGLMAYVFPICLFVGTAFTISNGENKVAGIKLFAGIWLVLFLCLFCQLVLNKEDVFSATAAFSYSALHKSGGGFIGGLLELIFCPNFGLICTYVIDIIMLIISFVLLTERSIFSGMKKGSQVLYDSAKVDAAKRKSQNEKRRIERREEREYEREQKEAKREAELEQKRMDRKAVGVAIDTKIVRPEDAMSDYSDEINEIKIDDYPDLPEVTEEEHIPLVSENGMSESQNLFANSTHVPTDFHQLFADEPEEVSALHQMDELKYEEPVSYETPKAHHESDNTYDVNAFEQPVYEQPVYEERVHEDPVYNEEPSVDSAIDTEKVKKNPKQSVAEINKNVESIEQEIQAAPVKKQYVFPPVNLLKYGDKNASGDSKAYLQETAMKLQQTLKNFGVNVTITNVSCGPAVTRYELQPEMGVKVSKIVNLADDIKLNLAAADIRIEAPIPGKAAIGIEVPNKKSVPVMFRELIESTDFKESTSTIAFAAGKDIAGKVIVTDIAKMPHLLIAGATGSGKSVCINTIIMSILYKAKPDDVKLIMIDPKVVELSVYNGIPHLLIPVVTDPKKAAGALHWAVTEMTDRYQKFAQYGVRDMKGYNKKIESISDIEDENKPQKMPQIVIIVDELADLMMVAPGDVEDAICRLAQLARAAGIHLVIATQRPSVNVITGLIKANMPSRIAFAVTSGVDSRTILDMNGAEKLLGKGDALFYPQGFPKPLRVQGAFVSDKEVSDVVNFLTEQNGQGVYDSGIEEQMSTGGNNSAVSIDSNMPSDDRDSYFAEAAKLLVDKEKGSIGMLQRYLKVGFNRAARIMDQLEEAGVVGPEVGTKPRSVLMTEEQLEVYLEENL